MSLSQQATTLSARALLGLGACLFRSRLQNPSADTCCATFLQGGWGCQEAALVLPSRKAVLGYPQWWVHHVCMGHCSYHAVSELRAAACIETHASAAAYCMLEAQILTCVDGQLSWQLSWDDMHRQTKCVPTALTTYSMQACWQQPFKHLDQSQLSCMFPAVPCMKRASDVEAYNPNTEFALGGDEDGWVATHRDPALPAQPGTGDDAIPSIDDDEAGGKGAEAGGEEEIPDISELELGAENDEVGTVETTMPAACIHY